MTRFNKQLIAALIGLGGFCGTINDLHACGGRSGGGGFYRPRPVVYSHPQYRPVQHPQPIIHHAPVNPQFSQLQPPSLDLGEGQLPPTVRRMSPASVGQGQFGGQPQGQQAFVQQQQVGGQQFQGQVQAGGQRQVAIQGSRQVAVGGGAQANALQSLGGMDVQAAPRQLGGQQVQGGQQTLGALQTQGGLQQQGGQQFQGGQQSQLAQGQPAQRRQVARPQIQQAQPPQQQQQQPVQQDPMGEAQQSALQALADMGDEVASAEQAPPADQGQSIDQAQSVDQGQPVEESQPVEQSQQSPSSGHVGQWKANLANGTTVELTLQADGSFVWVANSSGKTSSFQGSYTIAGGALTLVRSSDNQKLAGSLTSLSNGGMNFKLNGAKDNGLNFSRS